MSSESTGHSSMDYNAAARWQGGEIEVFHPVEGGEVCHGIKFTIPNKRLFGFESNRSWAKRAKGAIAESLKSHAQHASHLSSKERREEVANHIFEQLASYNPGEKVQAWHQMGVKPGATDGVKQIIQNVLEQHSKSTAVKRGIDALDAAERYLSSSLDSKHLVDKLSIAIGDLSSTDFGFMEHLSLSSEGDEKRLTSSLEGLQKYLNSEILIRSIELKDEKAWEDIIGRVCSLRESVVGQFVDVPKELQPILDSMNRLTVEVRRKLDELKAPVEEVRQPVEESIQADEMQEAHQEEIIAVRERIFSICSGLASYSPEMQAGGVKGAKNISDRLSRGLEEIKKVENSLERIEVPEGAFELRDLIGQQKQKIQSKREEYELYIQGLIEEVLSGTKIRRQFIGVGDRENVRQTFRQRISTFLSPLQKILPKEKFKAEKRDFLDHLDRLVTEYTSSIITDNSERVIRDKIGSRLLSRRGEKVDKERLQFEIDQLAVNDEVKTFVKALLNQYGDKHATRVSRKGFLNFLFEKK